MTNPPQAPAPSAPTAVAADSAYGGAVSAVGEYEGVIHYANGESGFRHFRLNADGTFTDFNNPEATGNCWSQALTADATSYRVTMHWAATSETWSGLASGSLFINEIDGHPHALDEFETMR